MGLGRPVTHVLGVALSDQDGDHGAEVHSGDCRLDLTEELGQALVCGLSGEGLGVRDELGLQG